jgi:hypothetical protein
MEERVSYENAFMSASCDGQSDVIAFYEEVLSKMPLEALFVIDEISTLDGSGRASVVW